MSYADDEVDEVDVSAQQQALSEINQQKSALKTEINSGKAVVNDLNKEIKALEGKIALSQFEIDQLTGSITQTQQRINEALADLEAQKQSIAEQNTALNERLRTMYKNGSVGYIDVLLGSSSITDFMTNLDRIERVYANDKEVLETLQTQYRVIQAKEEYLVGLQASLEVSKNQAAAQKSALDENKNAVAEKKGIAATDLAALEEQEDALVAAANALTAEILKLQGTQDYIGGDLLWPAPGISTSKITSEFGYRIHPILKVNKLHTGMDIGCPTGTSIVAANSGTVIKAGWNNSYGYMVMVDHGGGIVTLYAHNSGLLVNTGDVVTAGQAIAKAGSTGDSTGPHLHFEVRVNGQYENPRNYLGL